MLSMNKNESRKPCTLANCVICKDKEVQCLKYSNSCGWSDSVTAAFYCLLESSPDKGPWFSLTHDIYPLFEAHWNELCPGRKRSELDHVWKKHVQDSLSHKRSFENGREIFGRTGYWRLTSIPSKLLNGPNGGAQPGPSNKRQKIDHRQVPVTSPTQFVPIKELQKQQSLNPQLHQQSPLNHSQSPYSQQQQQQQNSTHQVSPSNSYQNIGLAMTSPSPLSFIQQQQQQPQQQNGSLQSTPNGSSLASPKFEPNSFPPLPLPLPLDFNARNNTLPSPLPSQQQQQQQQQSQGEFQSQLTIKSNSNDFSKLFASYVAAL